MKQAPYKDSHEVVDFNPPVITNIKLTSVACSITSEKQLEPCWISVYSQIGVQLTLKTARK